MGYRFENDVRTPHRVRSGRRAHWGEWIAWFTVLGIVTAGLLAIRARINEAHVALAYSSSMQAGSARRGRGLGIALAGRVVSLLRRVLFPAVRHRRD